MTVLQNVMHYYRLTYKLINKINISTFSQRYQSNEHVENEYFKLVNTDNSSNKVKENIYDSFTIYYGVRCQQVLAKQGFFETVSL